LDKLKVGIVGFGWFGKKHFQVLQNINSVEVVGIADRRIEEILRNYKTPQSEFHVGEEQTQLDLNKVAFYKSIKDLIKHEDVDVVDIVTDENNHYPVAKYALKYSKDIIVEKPFVTCYKHAIELKELANKNGSKIFVGHILRFDKRIRYINELINKGKIGKIRYISFKRNFQSRAHLVYGRVNPFFSAMIHDIDLALLFLRKKVKKMHAITKYLLKRSNPDVLLAILEFEDDVLCRIENVWHVANSCPYGFENEVAIYGSKATVIQSNTPIIKIWTENNVEYPEFFFWPLIEGNIEGALKDELEHYITCIRYDKNSNILSLDEVIESIRIAETLAELAKKGENDDR
jgi:UDP-N-acetylglucosamine 3-dehydrogenase